jgi:hypothetical protein
MPFPLFGFSRCLSGPAPAPIRRGRRGRRRGALAHPTPRRRPNVRMLSWGPLGAHGCPSAPVGVEIGLLPGPRPPGPQHETPVLRLFRLPGAAAPARLARSAGGFLPDDGAAARLRRCLRVLTADRAVIGRRSTGPVGSCRICRRRPRCGRYRIGECRLTVTDNATVASAVTAAAVLVRRDVPITIHLPMAGARRP